MTTKAEPQVETFLEPGVAANVLASYMAETTGQNWRLGSVFRPFTEKLVALLAKQGYVLVALRQDTEPAS